MDENPFATPTTNTCPEDTPATIRLSAGRFTFLLTFTQFQFIVMTLLTIYGTLFTLSADLSLEAIFVRILIGVSIMYGLLTGVIRLTGAIAGEFVPITMPILCAGASLAYLTAGMWFPGYVAGLVIAGVSSLVLSSGYLVRMLCLIVSSTLLSATYYVVFMSSSLLLSLAIMILTLSVINWVMFTKMCRRTFHPTAAS